MPLSDAVYQVVNWQPGVAHEPQLGAVVVFDGAFGYDLSFCRGQPPPGLSTAGIGIPIGHLRQDALPPGTTRFLDPEQVSRCRAYYAGAPAEYQRQHDQLLVALRGIADANGRSGRPVPP